MSETHQKYYQTVASHFDEDARLYTKRYENNRILKKVRGEFRKYVEKHSFNHALEIGCGPGIDITYFAEKYPDRSFYAFDVSSEMAAIAQAETQKLNLKNTQVKIGTVEDVPEMFPNQVFDMIYVFFGGLNTVVDLKKVVKILRTVASDHSIIVLTCVNRYYLLDFFVKNLKLKFRESVSRFTNKWTGYSPGRDLPSNVYSYQWVRSRFHPEFKIIDKRGYSIFYPPWYGTKYLNKCKKLEPLLWKLDRALQKTFIWNLGEYSLYVLKATDNAA